MIIRRRRLPSSRGAATLVTVMCLTPGLAVVAASAGPSDGSRRQIIDFTDDWRFALANPNGIDVPPAYASATSVGYDDSGWRNLDIPHDWSIELDPSPGPGTDAGTGFLQGGLGFYRKTFTLSPSQAGDRVSIEFDGVYMNSEIYFNGQLLGTHPYGYTGFAFDVTGLARTDGRPNLVAVKVQNQLPSSRWYSGSGIYREVRLVLTGPIHVRRHGVFVTTPDVASTVDDGYADVQIATDIVNEHDPADVDVTHTVRDATGRVVGRGMSRLDGLAGSARAAATVRLPDPRLWSIDSPYRYTLQTSLSVNGRQVDSVETPFGIRWVEFDPAEGMLVNGAYTKIQGVDLHHDLGALGAAVNRDALWRQMSVMKRMGVNALRTAHNPPAPELIEVCDRLGIVVMVEAFDTWRNNKTANDYGDWFELEAPGTAGLLWSDVDIMEMVNTFKNSPSVVMWSIGNEIRGQTVSDAQRLVADIKSIDTTRPRRLGQRQLPHPAEPDVHERADCPVAGWRGPELQHRAVRRRPARPISRHVLLRVGVVLLDVGPRHLSMAGPAQHRRELHAGPPPGIELRQQHGLVDHARRVRAEEGPRPQVLHRRILVVGHRLHRRADAVQPVPGQVGVLRRRGHGGIPQGPVLRVPEPVDHGTDGSPRSDELDRPRAGRDGHGLGVLQRGQRRAVRQRQIPRGEDLRP
jgi:beta-galactosidase